MSASSPIVIPPAYAHFVAQVSGAAGVTWVEQLPALLVELAQQWELQLGPAVTELSYNYVTAATCADGQAAMLKVGIPGHELQHEIDALQRYAGDGMVRLLAVDRDKGALLLERLLPGQMLATWPDDEEATRIAAGIMRQLWRPAPADHTFPTVADWAQGLARQRERFDGGVGPLPPRLFVEAEGYFRDLLAENHPPMLLHGDLHHYNILTAQRQPWLAIDPKGLVGDPGYELGAFFYNALPVALTAPELPQILARRIAIFAEELGFDRERICGWGIAQAVLSACWSIEDQGSGWEEVIIVGEALSALR